MASSTDHLASTATTPADQHQPSASTSNALEVDIEKLLSREASAFQRELEVERILKAFKLKCARPPPRSPMSFDAP